MNASQMPGRRSLSFVLTLAVAGFLMLLTLPRRGVAEPVCRASVDTRCRWISERMTSSGESPFVPPW